MLRESLLLALAPGEEQLELLGYQLVVRELPEGVDTAAFRDGEDSLYKFVVRCTFDLSTGDAVFTDADIPTIKSRGKVKLAPLLRAVSRVNGWDPGEEIKNSDAGPSSG